MEAYERISKIMEENNIKQKDIIDRLHLSKGYVSRMCNGSKAPSHDFVNLLSSMTGESEYYILHGKEKYDNLDCLNALINALINNGSIKSDGTMDNKSKEMIDKLLYKEIKLKLEYKNKK